MPEIPEWLVNHDSVPPYAVSFRSSIFRRSLTDIGALLQRQFCISSRPSRLDPGARIAAAAVFAAGIMTAHHICQLLVFLFILSALALAAGIRPGALLLLWLGAPLVSALFLLPVTLNLVTPGPTIMVLAPPGWHVSGWTASHGIAVTTAGIVTAVRLILRVLCSVTLSYLLLASTGAERLIGALRRLGLPAVLSMVLAMTYRYIITMLYCYRELNLARISRTAVQGTWGSDSRWSAAAVAALFRKSLAMSQRVNEAMISRGFDGDLHLMPLCPPGLADYGFVAGIALITAALSLGMTW